jgi:hypothetical protein
MRKGETERRNGRGDGRMLLSERDERNGAKEIVVERIAK